MWPTLTDVSGSVLSAQGRRGRVSTSDGLFRRCNLFAIPPEAMCAHGRTGLIAGARIAQRGEFDGPYSFIDYVELLPGTSIGDHRHGLTEEEFSLILDGAGRMRQKDADFPVAAGDLVRNPPGGLHGLANTATDDVLRLFVFELAVGDAEQGSA